MFTPMFPMPSPLPAMLHAMRAGLRSQSALTQRQLTALGLLVRTAGEQAGSARFGAPTNPFVDQQAQAATALAGSIVNMARLLADLQAQGAADFLQWWERQLQAVTPRQEEVEQAAAPTPAGADTPAAAPALADAEAIATPAPAKPAAKAAPAPRKKAAPAPRKKAATAARRSAPRSAKPAAAAKTTANKAATPASRVTTRRRDA